MGRIGRLPGALASQIAAGEVVERPASALKELLENSLDAEARRCDVEIEGGGISRLFVRDDGTGMDPEDALLCVERHATSKLRTFEDLSYLPSYGFRGEALPSIASVSRFCLQTRQREDEAGTQVVVEGGAAPVVSPVGMPRGTQIEIRDLFYNVPARRKFLRSSGTESGHVAEVMEAMALANPEVTFTLTRDGRKAKEWLRTNSRAERAETLFGTEDFASCMGERGPLRVEAHLGRPERARAGAAALRLFCNRRPVKDRMLLHTVARAYGSVLERGRYPRGVVYLELPPELLDVNVHPQKSEVRFADGRAVADALHDILSAQLGKAFAFPSPGGSRWSSPSSESWVHSNTERSNAAVTARPARAESHAAESPAGQDEDRRQVEDRISEVTPVQGREDAPGPDGADMLASLVDTAEGSLPRDDDFGNALNQRLGGMRPKQQSFMRIHEAPNAPPSRRPDKDSDVRWNRLRFVAQVRGTYLICEADEGLYVLDQHAAAERVNFHRLKQEHAQHKMSSQALLFPATLEVDAEQSELVAEHQKEISQLGFEIRVHGENTISVHRVPRLLQRDSAERLVRELLGELARTGRGFSQTVDAALSTIACHGSVRAGDALNQAQAQALLKSLDGVDFAGHCPHGRPIVAFTSWSELERKVGRR